MVLNASSKYCTLFSRHLCLAFFFILLGACSHISSQTTSNSSPIAPIIPVEIDNNAPSSDPSIQDLPDAPVKPSTTKPTESRPVASEPAPTNVLNSIIDSAKKAIDHGQWLRAQHHLEHALRVAPKDASVFYIYAQVYEGLGVQEQAVNMLKRAKFLSKPGTEIYILSTERLEHFTE